MAIADGCSPEDIKLIDHYRPGEQMCCRFDRELGEWHVWRPSAGWGHGGPIIEEGGLHGVERFLGDGMAWIASYGDPKCPRAETGPTLLIAAMRAYVASKFGEEVELP